MSQAIILPDLGMEMDEALLISWTKNPGDSIKQGDVIAEVETDKTTVEVESPVSGVLLEWKFQPGENLKIGGVIGYVGEAGEAAPAGGNGSVAVPAPAEPVAAPVASNGTSVAASSGGAATTDTGRVKISPVARRVAEDKGLDITRIVGTGPEGRIIKSDVENFNPASAPSAPVAAPVVPSAPAAAPTTVPSHVGYLGGNTYGKLPSDGVEVQDVSKLRTRIAERMATAQQQIPHFYITMDFNVDPLLNFRKQLNAGIEDKAQHISVNDMIVKAVALAAREYPGVLRHFYGDKFVMHQHVNVGIAVSLDGGGLINVVAHDADTVSLRTLATTNRTKIANVRAGKTSPADISGETITVSNLGMYGVDNFIAIVNPPASAIIAVGAAVKTPVVLEDGSIGVATRMKMTLSGDHRALNGAEGGEYMAILRTYIENPLRLV